MTNAITSEIDNFVDYQNKTRGGTVSLDYDALTTTVPSGSNAVSGISGIAFGATGITFAAASGNTVIFDGMNSSTASQSGPDSYAFNVGSSGQVTVTDINTGNSETILGESYLVFNGGAQNPDGSYQSIYLVESGTDAQIAAMYNAAFQRLPDLPGLEFYSVPVKEGSMTLHQAATYFLASPEFAKDYPALLTVADNGGPNDQAFITELYGNILHRTPTATEVNFYVEDLEGKLPGQTASDDRAQLLIYFSISPENQKDIAGWLINPANGPFIQAGAPMSDQEVLSSSVPTGVVNATNFQTPTSATDSDYVTSTGTTAIAGKGNMAFGLPSAANQITTTDQNITIDLTSTINWAGIFGKNDTVNSASMGGSTVDVADGGPTADHNNGGTVNLFGGNNVINSGGAASNLAGVTDPTVINGFNSTDKVLSSISAQGTGQLFTGSNTSPISGSSINFLGSTVNSVFVLGVGELEVNVGSVPDDTAASMAKAANAVYKVGDVLRESVVFFGQDPHGNTVVYDWGAGDVSNSHTVAATDFTGAVVLAGVQASSLTNSNFH